MNGKRSFLVFGAGYSGKAFAAARSDGSQIRGTTRSQEKFAGLIGKGIQPLLFDGTNVGDELAGVLAETTHLIISIAPGKDGDPVLNALRCAWPPRLKWIGYLSTVGVYGDHQGKWIDETGECRPVSQRSVARLAAENAWQELGVEIARPVAVLRLSGIYGPGRNALVNLDRGTARRMVKPGQVFNRIYRDDIAGSLWHLADENLGGVFNVTDDLPSPPQDVVAYAAARMGAPPPPETDFATAELSPMARSFYGENKRVSNRKLKASGYEFQFPDYRKAIDRMWDEDIWRGDGDGDARSSIRPG